MATKCKWFRLGRLLDAKRCSKPPYAGSIPAPSTAPRDHPDGRMVKIKGKDFGLKRIGGGEQARESA